ncbi:3-phosphoinositide-dependent protein kinase-1 [Heracleum sosnowskyi]|uniref:3-phosphoinositide-dependent protein kinase-1 n=1 Tax=Heracleum sosnowskyi TaxID=360622 RepID=A0AAD8N0H2_9APIA|nr:3-phosphoinositide-dependent protein kinase-1 [Heracleum sosnowskyi]
MSSHNSTWDQIDRSESYLVSCMYEEAVSSSSSVLKQLLSSLTAMVFVQSLNELGRTSEILKELKLLFGSVCVVPVQVFLTGVCFEMQADPSDVRESLEEFLSMWESVDEEHYILANTEKNIGNMVGHGNPTLLGIDKYLEVVEVYVVTLLAVLQRDVNCAVSWVEKAALPEQKRQELLRRLNSMYANKAVSLSQGNSLKEEDAHAGIARVFDNTNLQSTCNNAAKETIMKLSKQRVPGISWFRNITLRFGNAQLVISSRSILLGCLLLLTYYFMRRKQADLKRVLKRQALNVKKAATDLWQLAFSYQVNPLAAVQPISSASPGSGR